MSKLKNKDNSYKWILKVVIIAFVISILFSFISETIIPNVNLIFGILITILFIFIGVTFDMLGIAVTTADIKALNSMASQKIKGAKLAIKLVQNADKVSSFFNDVIGDICGIVSGSTGAVIILKIIESTNFNGLIVTLITMGIISSITIGGKAFGKITAIKNSTTILFSFSKVLSFFVKE